MNANDLFKRHIHKAKEKAGSSCPLAQLHFEMCKTVGGWIPYKEFMYMPLEIPLEFRKLQQQLNDHQEKEMKKRMRRGRSL